MVDELTFSSVQVCIPERQALSGNFVYARIGLVQARKVTGAAFLSSAVNFYQQSWLDVLQVSTATMATTLIWAADSVQDVFFHTEMLENLLPHL